jgi:ankyrin repeat protein
MQGVNGLFGNSHYNINDPLDYYKYNLYSMTDVQKVACFEEALHKLQGIDDAVSLLNSISNLNTTLSNGDTLIHIASRYNAVDILKLLLSKNIDVHAQNKSGSTALHLASMRRHKDVIMLLIDSGIGINIKNNIGQTALHKACKYGHTHTVELLLDNGADINARDNDGETPLFKASVNGNKNTLKTLLNYGADIHTCNNRGATPLFRASCLGNTYTFETLLDHGADVSHTNNQDQNPLDVAYLNGHNFVKSIMKHAHIDHNYMLQLNIPDAMKSIEHFCIKYKPRVKDIMNPHMINIIGSCDELQHIVIHRLMINGKYKEMLDMISLKNNIDGISFSYINKDINRSDAFVHALQEYVSGGSYQNNLASGLLHYNTMINNQDGLFNFIAYMSSYQYYNIIDAILKKSKKTINMCHSTQRSLFDDAYERSDIAFFKKYITDEFIQITNLRDVYKKDIIFNDEEKKHLLTLKGFNKHIYNKYLQKLYNTKIPPREKCTYNQKNIIKMILKRDALKNCIGIRRNNTLGNMPDEILSKIMSFYE